MPCELEFDQHFLEKLKKADLYKREILVVKIRSLKSLGDPADRGGVYQRSLWAYPVSRHTAFIEKVLNK